MSSKKIEIYAFSKLFGPAVAAVVVVSMTTMNACTPSDRSTEGHESMVQNAAEAEAAEAKLAAEAVDNGPSDGKKPATGKSVKQKKSELAAKVGKSLRVPASAGGVYVVQVGAFKIKENAEKLREKLTTAGYPVQLHSIEHSKNGLLHLVRFAPMQKKTDAETMIQDLSSKQDLRAQILNMPGH